MLEKVPLRVEPERLLDEGIGWVVGRSTETVDSSPSTESMDSWAAAPWTESVDFWSTYGTYIASRLAHGCVDDVSIAWRPPLWTVWGGGGGGGAYPPSAPLPP